MALTGNFDIDTLILNQLDNPDLVNACQVNKHADRVCSNPIFWINRVFAKYPLLRQLGAVRIKQLIGDIPRSDYYIYDLRSIIPANATDKLLYVE